MDIALTPEQQQFIAAKVSGGQYPTPAAVIDEALRLVEAKEEYERKVEELRREIAVGIAEADAGLLSPFEPQKTLEEVRARRAALAAREGA